MLGFNQLDKTLVLGMSDELLNEPILSSADLTLGQLVKADIEKVVSDRGVFVKVYNFISIYVLAWLFQQHFLEPMSTRTSSSNSIVGDLDRWEE